MIDHDIKINIPESELPTHWYNVLPDLPRPLDPPLDPKTKQPISPDALSAIFPTSLIQQEMSQERWIEIPEDVRELYKLWRPSPMFRAMRLEHALGTPARIYYKYEGASPAGSHKLNTALAQAYYNKEAGIKRLATETGAGQWGCALSIACDFFDLDCTVYMVGVTYSQKPYRKVVMKMFGGEVYPSPSEKTETGRKILAKDPNCPGSLGIAISEAIEDAASREDTNYALGSVLNHVCLHQTIIGQEAKKQLAAVGDEADVVIGCSGGGSNLAGIVLPYIQDKKDGKKVELVAVEPASCPTFTRGVYAYDHGDIVGFTPLLKMYTLGREFIPPPIHAGGLRYHGQSPILSLLVKEGFIKAVSAHQIECFEAAQFFARQEGIVPAPESSHAIRYAIDEALRCKETGQAKCIVFNLSGHGYLDLPSHEKYLDGKLTDYEYPQEEIEKALEHLPLGYEK